MSSSKKLDNLVSHIEATKIPLAQIAKEVNLNPAWLYALVAGRTSNPGIKQVQQLETYLQEHFKTLEMYYADDNPMVRRVVDRRLAASDNG